MNILQGASNKIGFLLVFLSACCWVVYIIGFGLQYQQLDVVEGGQNDTMLSMPFFMQWSYAISSFPLYVALLVQFLCGNMCFSLIVAGLAPLTLISVGGVLQTNALILYDYYLTETVSVYSNYIPVQLAGSLAAMLFMWLSLLFWVCGAQRSQRRSEYERMY